MSVPTAGPSTTGGAADDWFRRRTHEGRRWTSEELAEAKSLRGERVSVVLPARDEAATVGGIVARIRRELVEAVPLIDEIVVVDSDSTDATAAEARAAGATVHPAAGIRPDLGSRPGKGEALWKSLFVTSGDLLVFVDADLTEWDPGFVTGLLGPLLTDGDVSVVKGFYDRLREGGRVTELVARPLLALHWPALTGLVQPLAGEWAARRSLLERVPMPTGYAVELAVLVDTLRLEGVDAVAQADLGRRGHRHQPLHDLGAMALQILAAAERRLEPGARAATGWPDGPVPLRQYGSGDTRGVPLVHDVPVDERPPAVTVPGYRRTTVRAGAQEVAR